MKKVLKKVLGLWLDEELIHQYKVYCAKNKITMESVVREAIQERLKNESPRKSPKRIK